MHKNSIICLNGNFISQQDAKISAFDRGFLFGDGVFETIAATNNTIYDLKDHINRLLAGCRSLSIIVPWTKDELIRFTSQTHALNNKGTARIRISITRGEQYPPELTTTVANQPTLFIYQTDTHFPSKFEDQGMRVITCRYHRVLPNIKNMNFLPSILGIAEAKKYQKDGSLIVDQQNNVLEGTHWNVFSIKNQIVITPYENILLGITRNKILDLIKYLGLTTEEQTLQLKDLLQADEVFATSSLMRITPIVEIDNHLINNGQVGRITKQLQKEFTAKYY